MRNIKILIALPIILAFNCRFLSVVLAQETDIRLKEFNLQDEHLAVQGYDVVSYFMGKPLEGKKSLSYTYEDINYWFANTDNLNLFKKQPDKFEPMYGGWCAYAIGESAEKVKIDPKTYKIIDGKLYLFYNFYFNNTLIDWNKDERQLKIKADANWQKIMQNP